MIVKRYPLCGYRNDTKLKLKLSAPCSAPFPFLEALKLVVSKQNININLISPLIV